MEEFNFFLILIISVVFTVQIFGLKKQIKRLERLLSKKTTSLAQEIKASVDENTVVTDLDSRIQSNQEILSSETEEDEAIPKEPRFSLIEWLREDWMMKLGALLLLLGFAWLVTYAFMNNWIGPVGRIVLGIAGGLVVLIVGEIRSNKYLKQGSLLLALGAGIIMLAIYAARELYDFFTPASALLIMALVAVYIATAALRHKYQPLAVLGLILGIVAPLLTDSPRPDMIGLFSYLFVVSTGFLWLVRLTKWRLLTILSFLSVVFYGFGFLNVRGDEKFIMLIIISAFTLLFFLATLMAVIKDKRAGKEDLFVAGMSGMYYLMWINMLVPDEYKGLLSALAALVFVVGAFVVYQLTRLKDPVYLYSGIGVFLIGAATAFELEGAALTIAFTLEIFVLSVLTAVLSKNTDAGQKVSILMALPVVLSFESLNLYKWQKSIIHEDFFVIIIISAVFIFLGAFFYHFSRRNNEDSSKTNKFAASHFVIGSLYVLALIRFILEPITEDRDTAKTVSLVIYTLIGIFFYLKGKFNANKYFWLPGGLLLAYVGLRLLLIEVWQMDLVGRIITFFSVGILLIGSAFIKGKK